MTGVDDTDLLDAFILFFSRIERSFSYNVFMLTEVLIPQNEIEISYKWVTILCRKVKIRKAQMPFVVIRRTISLISLAFAGFSSTFNKMQPHILTQ